MIMLRMRKLEKIATLDQQTSILKEENAELAALVNKLKDEVSSGWHDDIMPPIPQVYELQHQLQWHQNNGCQIQERKSKVRQRF